MSLVSADKKKLLANPKPTTMFIRVGPPKVRETQIMLGDLPSGHVFYGTLDDLEDSGYTGQQLLLKVDDIVVLLQHKFEYFDCQYQTKVRDYAPLAATLNIVGL